MRRALLAALILVLVLTSRVWAQIGQDLPSFNPETGTVDGYVMDENGEPVVGAIIRLSRFLQDQAQTAVSDGNGRFAFSELRPGNYKVNVTAAGYESLVQGLEVARGREMFRVTLRSTGPISSVPSAARKELEQGLRLLDRGKFEQSLTYFQAAIRQYPEYLDAYYHLGMSYARLNRPAKAREAFQAALDRDQNLAVAHFGMGFVLNDEKRYSEAEPHLLKAQAAKGSVGWQVHYELGRAYYGLEQLPEAEANLKRAAESKPPYGNLYLLLANTMVRQDRYAEGIDALETFLKVAPKSPLAPQAKEKILLLRAELSRN